MCKVIKVEKCIKCPFYTNYMVKRHGTISSKYTKPYCTNSRKFIKPNKSNTIPRWCPLEVTTASTVDEYKTNLVKYLEKQRDTARKEAEAFSPSSCGNKYASGFYNAYCDIILDISLNEID